MGRLYHCETGSEGPKVLERVYFREKRRDYRRREGTDLG
jgi:hypothetical protein